MSEQGTAEIAELSRLEWELGAAARTKPVQLVNDLQEPEVKPSQITSDPGSTAPQPNLIRDILYAKAMDRTADMVDRRSAAEVLRLSFNELVEI